MDSGLEESPQWPGLCWVPEFASPGLLCVYGDTGLTLLEGWTWNLIKWSLLKVELTSSRSQSSALTDAQEGGQWEQCLHPVQCRAGAGWLGENCDASDSSTVLG